AETESEVLEGSAYGQERDRAVSEFSHKGRTDVILMLMPGSSRFSDAVASRSDNAERFVERVGQSDRAAVAGDVLNSFQNIGGLNPTASAKSRNSHTPIRW